MRTSFNIPEAHLRAFDEVWQTQGYNSRSRAVREAMQEYVEAHQTLEEMSGQVAAVVVFDYEYETIVQDIHAIQHEFSQEVNVSNHVHHGNWCLETIHCTGEADRIADLVYRLRDFDATRRVKLMVVEGSDSDEHDHHQDAA